MLSDLECRNAKPQQKDYKIYDSNGLYLYITAKGKRYWKLKYRIHNKERKLGLGAYPYVSLMDARNKTESIRSLLEKGQDPSEERKEEKRKARYNAEQTFEVVAREWHKHHYDTWCKNHADNILHRLEKEVFPEIGKIQVSKLTPPVILSCLQKIELRSKEMARRALQMCGQVMRYAVVTGRADRDITPDLKGSLKKYVRGHFASIEIDELPTLVKKINENDARLYKQTTNALKLLLLTFVRTKELIHAEWAEIDFENKAWRIPAERMKMRKPHFVPLSKQAIAILKDQLEISGYSKYVFPSIPRPKQPMSNGTILMALRRLGYNGIMTGHGFRSLAMSAIKEKLDYRHEVIDRQLAHLPKGKVNQAYDRAMFIPERIKMMQEWADYIDGLK